MQLVYLLMTKQVDVNLNKCKNLLTTSLASEIVTHHDLIYLLISYQVDINVATCKSTLTTN
jgi:hypothetical protein